MTFEQHGFEQTASPSQETADIAYEHVFLALCAMDPRVIIMPGALKCWCRIAVFFCGTKLGWLRRSHFCLVRSQGCLEEVLPRNGQLP